MKLTAAQRNKIPAKQFGEPSQRKYPMPDKSHAANAKSRAKQQLNKGNLSQGEYSKIVAKANRKLGASDMDGRMKAYIKDKYERK